LRCLIGSGNIWQLHASTLLPCRIDGNGNLQSAIGLPSIYHGGTIKMSLCVAAD